MPISKNPITLLYQPYHKRYQTLVFVEIPDYGRLVGFSYAMFLHQKLGVNLFHILKPRFNHSMVLKDYPYLKVDFFCCMHPLTGD